MLKLPDKVRQTVQTVVQSLTAALSAVAVPFMTNFLFERTYLVFASKSKSLFVLASFLLIVTSSALVGLLLKTYGAEAAGSGIPQVKAGFGRSSGG